MFAQTSTASRYDSSDSSNQKEMTSSCQIPHGRASGLCCATVSSGRSRCERYPKEDGMWLCWQHVLLNSQIDPVTWHMDRSHQWEHLKVMRDAAWAEYQRAQSRVEKWTCLHCNHWAMHDQRCQFHLLVFWTPLVPDVAIIVQQYMEPWRPSAYSIKYMR